MRPITEQRLSDIESGLVNPPFQTIVDLCLALREAWAVKDAARAYIEKYDEKYDGTREGWPKVQRDALRSALARFDGKV